MKRQFLSLHLALAGVVSLTLLFQNCGQGFLPHTFDEQSRSGKGDLSSISSQNEIGFKLSVYLSEDLSKIQEKQASYINNNLLASPSEEGTETLTFGKQKTLDISSKKSRSFFVFESSNDQNCEERNLRMSISGHRVNFRMLPINQDVKSGGCWRTAAVEMTDQKDYPVVLKMEQGDHNLNLSKDQRELSSEQEDSGQIYLVPLKEVTSQPIDSQDNHSNSGDTEEEEFDESEYTHVYRINSGGDAIGSGAEAWRADRFFKNRSGFVDRGNINIDNLNGVPAKVYQTETWCVDSYNIPLAKGNYSVELHFAETSGDIVAAGDRVFDITIEETVIEGLDILKEGGQHNSPVVLRKTINLSDNELNLNFKKIKNCPMINGIVLRSKADGSSPFSDLDKLAQEESESDENVGEGEDQPGSGSGDNSTSKSWTNLPFPKIANYSKDPKLFVRDQTLYITQSYLDKYRNTAKTDSGYVGYPVKNSDIVNFDGAPALRHRIKKGEGVMGIQHFKEFKKINDFRAAVLRYQVYFTGHREHGGKQITIEGGRGWIGDNYRDGWSTFTGNGGSKEKYGPGGWATYTMNSKSGYFFLMAIDKTITDKINTKDGYGYYPKQVQYKHPLNRWVTIDIVADMKHGYSLYQDGKKTAWGPDRPPYQGNLSDLKYLHMGVRLMYGGNPGSLIPTKSHDEYYRRGEIFIYE